MGINISVYNYDRQLQQGFEVPDSVWSGLRVEGDSKLAELLLNSDYVVIDENKCPYEEGLFRPCMINANKFYKLPNVSRATQLLELLRTCPDLYISISW